VQWVHASCPSCSSFLQLASVTPKTNSEITMLQEAYCKTGVQGPIVH
jgi:hypothetical protein